MQRAQAAFEEIRRAPGGKSPWSRHGGVLAAGLKALLNVPANQNPFMLYNRSISRIEWVAA